MDLGLKGKKAIVTGGTRGIGRAIAELLAEEGCDVAICARNADQIADAVKEMADRHGTKIWGEVADIADADSLKGFITRAGEELGGIDVLVSNASALAIGNAEDAWQNGLSIDILGAVRSVDAALPQLKASAEKTGDAAIIRIGSVSSVSATEPSAYGAVKGAMVHYVKGLAKKLAPEHVRANVVSPGTVYFKGGVWHMVEENMPEIFKENLGRNPMGRMATPEDIANATVFLASPRSCFTTGINMLVDGAITDRVNY
ncbi:SDR family oxidoreductase [Pyruvatibacter mobilis]|uniref:SDR family oxidoreductase n=1 Tax=Pyruvatibacter mobilis TaxID=1712261 RepID=A0A845QCV9_9HYPH|nr:SDR family oxidoreductase [Pyruvatibacter mobilis]NBG96422.1 SDR family oxidoreductase [Pyruvatibacter mobilis]QJD75903.1 SDR family oxidoreductase [Pyruvatibacter mobilis]GGD19517.1 oxidoreductase [Pyruvatibacter mobilis]